MTPGLLILLIILTTYRTTRFVIKDTFPPVGVPRTHLLNWWAPDGDWVRERPTAQPHWGAFGRSLRYLFSCPWCMSMWLGAPIIWGVMQFAVVPLPVLVWAAASGVTGLLHDLEDKLSEG